MLSRNIRRIGSLTIQNRIKFIDLGEAIMVLYVLLFHAAASGLDLHYSRQTVLESELQYGVLELFPFFLFFMPWFFYKAGMLFRIRPTREYIKYDVNKLLKPLFTWTLLAYLAGVFESMIDGGLSFHAMTYSVVRSFFLKGSLTPNFPLWFLLTFFFVRQIGNISLKHLHPLVVALAGLFVSYVCYKTHFRLMPLWISNTGSGLCFFSLGYYFTHYDCKINPQNRSVQCASAIVFAFWCMVSYFLPIESKIRVPIVSIWENDSPQGIYLLWYPVCILGIWAFNGLMKAIENKGRFSFLNWVALHAMPVYVIHGLILTSFAWVRYMYFNDIDPVLYFCMIIVLYGIMLWCIRQMQSLKVETQQ